MHTTWLIARMEYLRRVSSKAFLLTTLLAPVLLIGLSVLPVVIVALLGTQQTTRLVVVDETGRLGDAFVHALPDGFVGEVSDLPVDTLRTRVLRRWIDGYVVLNEGVVAGTRPAILFTRGGGFTRQMQVRSALADVVRVQRLHDAGASEALIQQVDARVGLDVVTVSDAGDASGINIASSVVGYTMGFLIYIAVLIYGVLVMRGVIEEKQSRIVEVIVSSVRPFQLMMGKVLGIGAVGLTQFAVWGVLLFAGMAVSSLVLGVVVNTADLIAQNPGSEQAMQEVPVNVEAFLHLLRPSLFVYFTLFFVGGYLLYAALFAALGSAVEQETDAQLLQIPITLPILIPLMFLMFVIDAPDAPLSVGLSLVPFFAPILMTVRLAVTEVPWWQSVLSVALLAASFVVLIGLASRIYRVGILSYGKQATFRDLWRWLRTA